jgi:hypothetical protein
MSTARWLVCERTSRWAAALRIALEQCVPPKRASITLDEARTLKECTSKLRESSIRLTFVEVTPANLAQTLTWLAEKSCNHQRCTLIALVDYQFHVLDTATAADRFGIAIAEVVAALREAGAADVVLSPRQLKLVLPPISNDRRHMPLPESAGPELGQSVEAWAWSLLPWQDTGRPVG